MYFTDEPEHITQLRDTLKKFAAAEMPREKLRAWDKASTFDRGVFDRLMSGGAAEDFTFAQPVFLSPDTRSQFDRVHAHASHADVSDSAMSAESALLTLVARLHGHCTGRAVRAQGPVGVIRRAIDRIDSDPAAPVTLSDLATEVGLSRFQLLRAFSRQLGLTPHAYIRQRRIQLARRLIRARVGLAEAAALAGFYDQPHLTRAFLKQFGVTPRQYAYGMR